MLDAVGVVVADMAATLQFYRMVGLEIPDSQDKDAHVEVELRGGMRLMFDTEELLTSINPDWSAGDGPGRISLAFLCDGPDDVDHAHHQVVDAGYASVKAPFDAFWGQRYATVLDPDGNSVDLFAPAE